MNGPPSPHPLDGHVHSQWSWDAIEGDMVKTCARAVELGLPAVAFTEHVDHTRWLVGRDDLDPRARGEREPGTFAAAPLDVEGYLASVAECRARFPALRILSGVELGEPHWHEGAVRAVLSDGDFERVLGSLHSLPLGDLAAEPDELYRHAPAGDVVRRYLGELAMMIDQSEVFEVLAHVDYPLRMWPADAGRFDVTKFQDDFRHVLRTLAGTDRALEVNTAGPMLPEVLAWWRDVGGKVVTFGSDAHAPSALGRRFAEAVAMVESYGYRPGRHPYDRWTRPAMPARGG